MIQVALVLILILAGGLFLLVNGPLWLSTHSGLFTRGCQASPWLETVERWVSRLGGLVVVLYWSWAVTQGNILTASLLAVTFAIGLFLLLNGPVWAVTRSGAFVHGREAPLWLEKGAIWFNRLAGSGAILLGLFLGVQYMLIASEY